MILLLSFLYTFIIPNPSAKNNAAEKHSGRGKVQVVIEKTAAPGIGSGRFKQVFQHTEIAAVRAAAICSKAMAGAFSFACSGRNGTWIKPTFVCVPW